MEIKNLNLKLIDIDESIIEFLNETINFEFVDKNNNKLSVKVLFSNPERWKEVKELGKHVEKSEKLILPYIAIKRDSVRYPREYFLNPAKYSFNNIIIKKKYNSRYPYINFLDENEKIKNERYEIISLEIPFYIEITYSLICVTNLISNSNEFIEKLMTFSNDCIQSKKYNINMELKIGDFSVTYDYSDNAERMVRTETQLTLRALIFNDYIKKNAFESYKNFIDFIEEIRKVKINFTENEIKKN